MLKVCFLIHSSSFFCSFVCRLHFCFVIVAACVGVSVGVCFCGCCCCVFKVFFKLLDYCKKNTKLYRTINGVYKSYKKIIMISSNRQLTDHIE